MTAKEALRNVLRKSVSDSPPPMPSPAMSNATYSLYDSLNIDPLLNLGFLQGSRSPNEGQVHNRNVGNEQKSMKKKELTRSTSENIVTKRQSDRRASEMVDKLLEDNDVFPLTKSLTLQPSKTKEKSAKASRVIFSDSEGVDTERKSKVSKAKHTKISHKRSRSDISEIKMKVSQEEQFSKDEKGKSMEQNRKDDGKLGNKLSGSPILIESLKPPQLHSFYHYLQFIV